MQHQTLRGRPPAHEHNPRPTCSIEEATKNSHVRSGKGQQRSNKGEAGTQGCSNNGEKMRGSAQVVRMHAVHD